MKYPMSLVLLIAGLPALAADRRIEKSVVVAAPRADCWTQWTTTDGIRQAGIQGAQIELKPGGMYEWYFSMKADPGLRGSEGAKVLAFHPNEWLAFSWNAPPSIKALRDAGKMTTVFVRFADAGPGETRITLSHVIAEEGPDWDKYHSYFEQAWPNVLAFMKKSLEAKDRKPITAATVGGSTVQDYEIDAPAATVWKAITDPAVAKTWMSPRVEIDLKPGGKMMTNYSVDAKPGDDTWIVREVMAVEPGRALAVKMISAPAKFPHKQAIEGTWHVMYVDPVTENKCRFRLAQCGLRDDDATKAMVAYFEKANPTVIVNLRKAVGGAK
ncbi:MAG: SRPBCC domain-containing protein [Gemmataceae bacterium]|nr:SRPBCC domain-containing protein [Gemmataceae bacterium]